jgi:hypothetical protein
MNLHLFRRARPQHYKMDSMYQCLNSGGQQIDILDGVGRPGVPASIPLNDLAL